MKDIKTDPKKKQKKWANMVVNDIKFSSTMKKIKASRVQKKKIK